MEFMGHSPGQAAPRRLHTWPLSCHSGGGGEFSPGESCVRCSGSRRRQRAMCRSTSAVKVCRGQGGARGCSALQAQPSLSAWPRSLAQWALSARPTGAGLTRPSQPCLLAHTASPHTHPRASQCKVVTGHIQGAGTALSLLELHRHASGLRDCRFSPQQQLMPQLSCSLWSSVSFSFPHESSEMNLYCYF